MHNLNGLKRMEQNMLHMVIFSNITFISYISLAKLYGNTWPYCAIQSLPKISYIFWKQYFPSAENARISNGNWNNLSKSISFYLRSDGKPLIINIYTKNMLGSFGPKILYQTKLKPIPNIWKIYRVVVSLSNNHH